MSPANAHAVSVLGLEWASAKQLIVNAKKPQVKESGPVTAKLIELVAMALTCMASIINHYRWTYIHTYRIVGNF